MQLANIKNIFFVYVLLLEMLQHVCLLPAQAGAAQMLVSRSLVIPLLNRIKVDSSCHCFFLANKFEILEIESRSGCLFSSLGYFAKVHSLA